MSLKKKEVKIFRGIKPLDDGYIDSSPADRLSLVWELTKKQYSLTGMFDAEARLQRHVVHIIKNKQSTSGEKNGLDSKLLKPEFRKEE